MGAFYFEKKLDSSFLQIFYQLNPFLIFGVFACACVRQMFKVFKKMDVLMGEVGFWTPPPLQLLLRF